MPDDRLPGVPLDVDDETFPALVLGSKGFVLLDCWAAWCSPCRKTTPIMRALARDHPDRLVVAELDTVANRYTCGKLQLEGIPSFLLYRDGAEVERLVGAVDREKFDELLRRHRVIS
jgi:thioredoxin-like negative regulator of GroEL